ncbi:MAG: MFS transporter [Cryomorphaceae bacterium]|jgi:UMF1 family MFS transporter|nr:MFS transporter [Cryomorphaceae bacterium]
MQQKGNKRTITGWVFYDWANSVYPLIISSAIFPILYETQTSLKNEAGRTVYDTVSFLGREFHNTEFYAYVICLSYILVALMTPLLSGIADAGGKRKLFMQFFCYMGAISSGLLYFFHAAPADDSPFMINWSILPLFFGSIGFWASLVYYNAYLPDIAEAKDHDRVSARGFSMGYLGSSTLLIIILILTVFTKVLPIRWAFPLVSLWWIAFATFSFSRLPKTSATQKDSKNMISKGYAEVYKVWKQIRENKTLKGYLGSYFMFNMAVQTIMVMAVAFANKEVIGIKQQDLIISILIIQFIGIGGAYLMSFVSKKIGNFKALGTSIVIWIALCIYVYQFVWYPWQFFIAAAGVGLVMGGIQSLSRSTYSKLLPETKDLTSYFSFYDLAEKLGLALGTLTFGLIEGLLDIRTSILALVVFFAFGLILLIRIPKPEQQAHETSH